MKHEIEIEDSVAPYGDPDEKPLYSVNVTESHDYRDNDNYRCTREDSPYSISAESIEELYELMGDYKVAFMLKNETANNDRWSDYKDPYEVKFSNIFIEVAAYDESKMKASKKFQEIGAAREKKAAADAERARLEAIQVAKYRAEEKEKHDREEYQRLRQKFENK